MSETKPETAVVPAQTQQVTRASRAVTFGDQGAEIKDSTVAADDARRARREFGYLRMWSIHPNQIMPIVAAMRPDFSEVQEATEILEAAQDKDWGPIQHAGRLHDRASYRYYWELLQRAQATGMDIPAGAARRFFSQS